MALSKMEHPSIVKYIGTYSLTEKGETDLWLVMENMEGGTLNRVKKNLLEEHIAFVAKELLSGLNYIHSKGFLHRDLKSENIMLTMRGQVKLIDFGLARPYEPDNPPNEMVGSPFWMSPEMIGMKTHGPKTDVWGFAISLLELINQLPPNSENSLKAMFTTATVGVPQPFKRPKKWSPNLHSFINNCLMIEPQRRSDTAQLLQHPFLQQACARKEMIHILSTVFLQDVLEQSGLSFL